jgi:mono/diheme cytochrome c family protein
VLLGACDWSLHRMNDQPRCEADDATSLLPDRRCTQPTPTGTVAWRSVEVESPPSPSRAVIERGHDRFMRFCAPCHGMIGDGRSRVAADMLLRPPPSLHEPRLIASTDEHVADVIERGYGLMPSYARVLPAADRWAVVYFVRALQTSQRVELAKLPAPQGAEIERALAQEVQP